MGTTFKSENDAMWAAFHALHARIDSIDAATLVLCEMGHSQTDAYRHLTAVRTELVRAASTLNEAMAALEQATTWASAQSSVFGAEPQASATVTCQCSEYLAFGECPHTNRFVDLYQGIQP